MNLMESVEFLVCIGSAFGNARPKDSGSEIWAKALADASLDDCKAALAKYVQTATFPPTIADIRRLIPDQRTLDRGISRSTRAEDWRYRKWLDKDGLCLAESTDRYGRVVGSVVPKGYMCRQAGTYRFGDETLPRWVSTT